MKKLSLKWKVFLIFCYLQLVTYGLILLLLVIEIFKSLPRDTEMAEIVLALIGFVLLCLNYVLSIYIIHRFFPDTALPSKTRSFLNMLGIINVALMLGLLYMWVSVLQLQFSYRPGPVRRNDTGLWLVIGLSLLWIFGVYTLILQFLIPGHLRRASRTKIKSLIDSIGQDQT